MLSYLDRLQQQPITILETASPSSQSLVQCIRCLQIPMTPPLFSTPASVRGTTAVSSVQRGCISLHLGCCAAVPARAGVNSKIVDLLWSAYGKEAIFLPSVIDENPSPYDVTWTCGISDLYGLEYILRHVEWRRIHEHGFATSKFSDSSRRRP
jgi:hypothetical protein